RCFDHFLKPPEARNIPRGEGALGTKNVAARHSFCSPRHTSGASKETIARQSVTRLQHKPAILAIDCVRAPSER
ncbi:hypothetical protein, partial [Klebsiella aerogenes]|uniref:hypothetical protein n=1 Tax=Klebsiella aerogenes TaxID=548 RepID=UPI001954DAFA